MHLRKRRTDIRNKLKTETFYATIKGESPQIRVTSGWWSTTWTGADIQPGNELLEDNGDGTWKLTVNLTGDPLVDLLDEQHLLFTGSGYTALHLMAMMATTSVSPPSHRISGTRSRQRPSIWISRQPILRYVSLPDGGIQTGMLVISSLAMSC